MESENETKPVPSLANLLKKDEKELERYADQYKTFLDNSRTPRQVVDYVEKMALANGFPKENIIVNDNRTNIALVDYGQLDIEEGLRILGCHVDSPCLHIKPSPIKEGPLGVRLDTQYYGGLVKYQWLDQLVSVVGHVVKNGKEIPIKLEGVINDIAPHLNARKLGEMKVREAFDAEVLDVETGYANKEAMLKDLGIEEKDFKRAELYVVPVEKTRILQDLIVGYGQDDRVCMFTELVAILTSKPEHASIVFGVDREEIGSTGFTGAQSVFFEQVLDEVISKKTNLALSPTNSKKCITQPYERYILSKSLMLSSDVDIAHTFKNEGFIDSEINTKAGHGLAISSYCGHGGKYEGNQVTAKLMDKLITLFDKKGAVYQVSSLPSKVDSGGGGTIAMFFAQRGVQTVDAGVPVAGMHSKTETIHRGDLYQTIKCFQAFLES